MLSLIRLSFSLSIYLENICQFRDIFRLLLNKIVTLIHQFNKFCCMVLSLKYFNNAIKLKIIFKFTRKILTYSYHNVSKVLIYKNKHFHRIHK